MLRFYNTEFKDEINVEICEKELIIDNTIWKECISILKAYNQHLDCNINLIPIKDASDNLVAYGYQDSEANRELRMLKELGQSENVLQFTDIFPEYKEVIIYGCNELAVSFVKYLEKLKVKVSIVGKYWDYFGYKSNCGGDLEGDGKLFLYAEGILPQNGNLFETAKKSVSVEFECIDKIYEKNVLEGRIHDTIGSLSELINRLKDEDEIIILGNDREAQDTYDLLMKYGIDIYGFAVKESIGRKLLGKEVLSIADTIRCLQSPVFLNYKGSHGALGEEWTEYFDYRGYERNKQFFLIKDYTDIPTSNLVHILRGKRVFLSGDSKLCQLLSDYLYSVEINDVTVKYVDLKEKISPDKADILCLVIPDYRHGTGKGNEWKRRKLNILKQQLSDMGFTNFTEYFVSTRSFALIDIYLNRNMQKYTIPELIPKKILLGRIPEWSGNAFFRGVMDGHPEVLTIPNSDLGFNLFYYCLRLAGLASNEILSKFWLMYNEEADDKEIAFPKPEKFEACVKRWLRLKDRFTSQELLVLFGAAYVEMVSDEQVSDISKMILYWEPHHVGRNEFPFLSLWLEDEKVDGLTIVLRRNHIVRTGSGCVRGAERRERPNYALMFLDETKWDGVSVQYRHWTEFKMRFEDLKLKPKEKLLEICERLDIKWSDNMMHTTRAGGRETFAYRNSVDFDIRPVLEKYECFLSEFDRFRISIASSVYQKRYGFPYENCLKFSRRELQEMFLKPFLFDEEMMRENGEYLKIYENMRWRLWEVRKHMVLEDVCSEFVIDPTTKEYAAKHNYEEINKTVEYAKTHDKLILYGTGNDCIGLLRLIDEDMKKQFLYSDKKAEAQAYTFNGKEVIAPQELCRAFKDYNILVTSSFYRDDIEREFRSMGIVQSRVFYSKAVFRF